MNTLVCYPYVHLVTYTAHVCSSSHQVIRQIHPCKGLLERAQEEVDKDIFQLTMKGATSPQFSRKKVTPL